jgi:hypothetical protein
MLLAKSRYLFALFGEEDYHWVLGYLELGAREFHIFDGYLELNSDVWAEPESISFILWLVSKSFFSSRRSRSWRKLSTHIWGFWM